MISASLDNPHAVAVGAILVTAVGAFAATSLPLQLRPTVEPPEIQVATNYAGAAPAEVEDQITRRLEDQLTSVSGLQDLISRSSAGRSQITLRFEDGVDRNVAMVDVLNKLGGVQGLPPEIDPPEVTATTSDQQAPVMWWGVRAPDGLPAVSQQLLRATVDDVVAPRLRRVEGVAGLMISGGAEREVHVNADLNALAARGLGVPQLLDAITRDNLNSRGGPLWIGKREYTVRTQARFEHPADLESVLIRDDAEGQVRLGDVAEVEESTSLSRSIMRQNGFPAVSIGIQRQTGANVPTTVQGVVDAVAELQQGFDAAGLPVKLRQLYSETTYIDEALDQATGNIVGGAALSGLALFVALRSLRAVGLVLGAQPLALAAVFPVLWYFGRSLNLLTLAGLAFAVGITIDNAVVVVENIYRHRKMGKDPATAAADGTRELWGAMLAATITNVSVFAPVVLLAGEAGQVLRDLALGISLAAMASLVVSMTVLPVACARWLGSVAESEGTTGFIGRWLGALVDRLTGPRPWYRLTVVGMAIGGSALGLLVVPDPSYLPEGNRNLILTIAGPLPGTSVEAAAEQLRPIEAMMLADSRVRNTFVVFNNRFSAMGVVLQPDYADSASLTTFLGELRGKVGSVPGFRFLMPRRASIFQDPGKQFEVTIAGPDLEVLSKLAGESIAALKKVPGVLSARSDYETGAPEIEVVPDRRRLAELGLRPRDLALTVETAVGGRRVGTFLHEGRELDLVAMGDVAYRHDLGAIRGLPVGPGVRLDNVATVREVLGPIAIPHRDQERAVTLTVNASEDLALGAVLSSVETEVLGPLRARLPHGYFIATGGSADRLAEMIRGLRDSFVYAVAIVYLLLVALYRSWTLPVVILTAVPLAVCGALVALAAVNLVAHVEFDTIAIVGLVLLAGVVVNVSILIVSQAQEFVGQGLSPADALRESSVTRLRPILMSATTAVLGMLPLAAGQGSGTELYRGLGVVMVGGLVLSTLFTPVVVPAMMAFSPRWRSRGPTPQVLPAEPVG